MWDRARRKFQFSETRKQFRAVSCTAALEARLSMGALML